MERHGVLSLETDPFPLFSPPDVHLNTHDLKQDLVDGVIQDIPDIFSIFLSSGTGPTKCG